MKRRTWVILGVTLIGLYGIGKASSSVATQAVSDKTAAAEAAKTPEQKAADKARIENNARLKALELRGKTAIEMAKLSLEKRLKDPESARYGKVWAAGDSQFVACGYVNSKNGFGGYTGEKLFVSSGSMVLFESDLDELEGKNRKAARAAFATCDTLITFTTTPVNRNR